MTRFGCLGQDLVQGAKQTLVRGIGRQMILLGVLLGVLSACADSGPASSDASPPTAPALKPAPSWTIAPPPATATPHILRPPTGTPTPGSIMPDEPASIAQVPTATPTPEPVIQANPPARLPTPVSFVSGLWISGIDCEDEIAAYQEGPATGVTIIPLRAPLVAACFVEAGDRPAAIALYQLAVEMDLDRLTEVTIRQDLGDLLLEEGDYAAALTQFEAVLAVAETAISRGRAMYQAGQAEIMAGNHEAGYARLLALIDAYPEASQSYPALTELLAAGYPVDDAQHGMIAYHAGVYDDAAVAFSRAVGSGTPATADTHLHLAWALEKTGDVDGALARLDAFVAGREGPADGSAGNPADAARGRIEGSRILQRAGRTQAALEAYQAYLALYPQGADAPLAAWRSASLAESLAYLSLARERYVTFAQRYPEHNDAAEALFRAGYLSWVLDEQAEAVDAWRQAVAAYPTRDYGSASLLWLLKTLPAGQRTAYEQLALNGNGGGYYGTRAAHLVNGVTPFVTTGTPNLNLGDTGREFAESWLRQWLGLSPRGPVAEISGELASDPRLAWAKALWTSGARAEAARQFEMVRIDYAGDALASYQLALYFRELGLYKSSILAALSVMSLAGVGAADAPRFIARLAYPAYYTDLITAEADRYRFDPLLQLALIHAESYFDPLATSAFGAQGLSQILPETGAYVAGQLGRAGYDTGELYRPEVAIAFGAYFLDETLDRYDGNVAAALAAYNAGPAFADNWFARQADDFDLFLETVDFPETQRYIKQVYIVHAIYRFLYS